MTRWPQGIKLEEIGEGWVYYKYSVREEICPEGDIGSEIMRRRHLAKDRENKIPGRKNSKCKQSPGVKEQKCS